MARSLGNQCDSAELTCTACDARARALQLSAGRARAARGLVWACTPGFRFHSTRQVVLVLLHSCSLRGGIVDVQSVLLAVMKTSRAPAGEARGEGGVSSGGGASKAHAFA